MSFEETESSLFSSTLFKDLKLQQEESVCHDDKNKSESLGEESTKYAVFDSIRQLEQTGGDLGWSREILRGADGA